MRSIAGQGLCLCSLDPKKKEEGEGGGSRGEEGKRRKTEEERKKWKGWEVGCSIPAAALYCLTLQGPFVHLSVIIAAYLGHVRTKIIGESEVRSTGLGLLGEGV